jgi:cell cycle arrest protein BUB3
MADSKLLPDSPSDGISSLSYLPDSHLLASTSWDGSVRIHDTKESSLKLTHSMEVPLLSLTTLTDTVVTGGLDGKINLLRLTDKEPTLIGKHRDKQACSCLAATSDANLVGSAGWHSKMHLWDIRQQQPVATVELPGKAFAMDYDPKNNRFVVATSGRRTCFIDVRNTDAELVLDRESTLKFQTRTVRFFPEGDGIAMGSIEARVGIEYLEELGLPARGKKYAFKCHRVGDLVYPVNCIEFHPKYGTFATGGAEGTVVMWDGLNKKKLATLPQFPTSIAAMAFHPDGSELAIASSYTFEDGEREHPRDEIYVRQMQESECLPKNK